MKIRSTIAVLAAAAAWAAAPAVLAEEEAMTHVVFRFVAEGLDPDSFAATPREMWRVGDRHLRLQEEPNLRAGVHTLLINNAPHSWTVDLEANQARHAVDRSGEAAVSVPVFPGTGSETIEALEYGRELAFFRERGARRAGRGMIGGRPAEARVLFVDGTQLTLYVGMDGRPWRVAINDGTREWAIQYELYESGLEPDWSLFEPPAGVEIVEAE